MKQINLFLTRTFVTAVAVGAMSYLKPVVDNVVLERQMTRQNQLELLYFLTFVGYNSWLRYSVDDEGATYTSKGLPGRNKGE